MLKRSDLIKLLFLCMVGLFLLTCAVSGAESNTTKTGEYHQSSATGPSFAPFNPEFITYLDQKNSGQVSDATAGSNKFGAIPPPHNMITGASLFKKTSLYPTVYDLRTLGKVTPVRNQNPWGTCWAFATFGSLESSLKPAKTRDFSEKNLVNKAGFDLGFNDGGTALMSVAYLANWTGPVDEKTDPYPSGTWSPSANYAPVYHTQNVYFIPSRTKFLDTGNIKGALQRWGALYSMFYWDNRFYNSSTKSYYQPESKWNLPWLWGGGTHAVTIVGWNDSYSKSNFKTIPPGDGAWIVKNSWGTKWGDKGYFNISYYDKYFGSKKGSSYGPYDTAAFTTGPVTNYNVVYSYDPMGWVNGFGGASKTVQFANIYTTSSSQSLKGVGFYTSSSNARYSIKIYKNPSSTPDGGTPIRSVSGTLPYPGYNTIELKNPLSMRKGTTFSVVVNLTQSGTLFGIPVQIAKTGYSSRSTGAPGRCYYFWSGSWLDLYNTNPTANICLKAYALSTKSSSANTVTTRGVPDVLVKNSFAVSGMVQHPVVSFPLTGTGSGVNLRLNNPLAVSGSLAS